MIHIVDDDGQSKIGQNVYRGTTTMAPVVPDDVPYEESGAYESEIAIIKQEAMTSSRSFMLLAALGTPPSDLRDRMIGEATNLGVVTALMAGVVYGLLVDPIEGAGEKMMEFYVILSGISFFFNVACVVLSTLMISSMNLLNDETTLPYIRKHATLFTGCLFQFFNVAVITMVVAMAIWIHYAFDSKLVGWLLSGVALVLVLVCFYVYWTIDMSRFNDLKAMFERKFGPHAKA